MKKISDILDKLFSYGMIFSIIAGALAGLGFLIAFIIGGDIATALCVFIHKEYFPVVIKICSAATGCGLINMYIRKKKALTMENDK